RAAGARDCAPDCSRRPGPHGRSHPPGSHRRADPPMSSSPSRRSQSLLRRTRRRERADTALYPRWTRRAFKPLPLSPAISWLRVCGRSITTDVRLQNRHLPPTGARSDQEVFLLGLAALGGSNHPARHAAAARPGVLGVLGVAVLRRHRALATLAALAEQLVDLEAVLPRDVDQLLTQGVALRVLLLCLQPLDLRLHFR